MHLGTVLVWGFLWALAIGGIMLFIVRPAYQDRMLRRELTGYEEYAAHTALSVVARDPVNQRYIVPS
jgi:protein-S-isoprenylcysteine O-methyltransferase Ste14